MLHRDQKDRFPGPFYKAGGVDLEAAKARGLRAVHVPGIPGRTAPVTAARAIRDAIYNILHELGV